MWSWADLLTHTPISGLAVRVPVSQPLCTQGMVAQIASTQLELIRAVEIFSLSRQGRGNVYFQVFESSILWNE